MPLKTPICDFGQAAKSFELKSTNNEIIKLNDVKGTNGTLVMFICNHCPYVKAVIKDIVEDCKNLKELGIKQWQYALMTQLIILKIVLKI